MADIIEFSQVSLTAEARSTLAWHEYHALAEQAVRDPRLLLKRDFFDELTRCEERYKRLMLAAERGR